MSSSVILFYNKLTTRRKFYTGLMAAGVKALHDISRFKHLAGIPKSINVNEEDRKIAMVVLHRLPSSYEHLIEALDDLETKIACSTLKLLKADISR